MDRPYVVCHMLMSVDGKVTGDFLFRQQCEDATQAYYEINRDFNADAYACGRVTMEGSFTSGWYPDLSQYSPIDDKLSDFVADNTNGFYAVAFDRKGRLGWRGAKIEDDDPGYGGAHIIEVLTTQVDARYLGYLQANGISYIIAGKDDIDLPLALFKLKKLFGINKLLLEGGSIINGAFQKAELIDELSLVMVPTVADTDSKPLFFESNIENYKLTACRQLKNGVLSLRYKKN